MTAFPRDQWIATGIDPASLPEDAEIPDRVPGLYTTDLPGNVNLFDMVQVSAEGTDLDIKLIVVGALEQAPSQLFVLDPGTGEVLQFDTVNVNVRGVNSSYRWFIESLKRLIWAMESTGTDNVGAVLNQGMRHTLRAIDEAAFQAGSWWPLAFQNFGPTTGQ